MQMSCTEIIGHDPLAPTLVVADGHAFSASATDEEPLQKRWPLPWRREAWRSIGLTIHGQLCLISLVVLKGNVPHMGIRNKSDPFGAGHILNMDLAIGCSGRACASKSIHACIGWLVQNPQNIVVLDFSPQDFSLMGSTPDASREKQVLLMKVANRGAGRSGVLEQANDLANGGLDLQIGIKNNHFPVGVTQPDR